jgi:nucleoside-diphosphate-sugar epimerase
MVMFRFAKWIYEEQNVHLYGDGEQSRGFTYVDDIARGTIAALDLSGFEIINLGGHQVMSIKELIRVMEDITGKKAEIVQHPRHPADMFTNQADIRKAKKLLGWNPAVDLLEGIAKTMDWYIQERSWAKEIRTV